MGNLDVASSVATFIGLGLSICTLAVASSAQKAAKDARAAVFRSSAAEDFAKLTKFAEEFLGGVQNDRIPEAIVRGRDLIAGIATAKRRWVDYLDAEDKAALDNASSQIEIASRILAAEGPPTQAKRRDKLLKISGEIVSTLGAEAGKLGNKIQRINR